MEVKKSLINQFYEENKQKCGTAKTGNAYTLSKVTNLTEKQIKALEKYFCPGYSQ